MERIVNGRTKPIQDKTIKGKRTKEEIMGGDSDDDDEEEHYHPTKRQRQRIEVEEPGSPIKEASSDDESDVNQNSDDEDSQDEGETPPLSPSIMKKIKVIPKPVVDSSIEESSAVTESPAEIAEDMPAEDNEIEEDPVLKLIEFLIKKPKKRLLELLKNFKKEIEIVVCWCVRCYV